MDNISKESILDCKSEKEIQKKIQIYLEKNSNTKIIEEEFNNIPTLDDKKFIISDSFTYQNIAVKGLKEKLLEINTAIFNKYSHLDKNKIVDKIFEHFEHLHKTKDNVTIKDAIFNHKSKHTIIELEDKSGNLKSENYQLISFNDNKKNDITIIREKRIEITGYKQLPDFAIYLNGIPFVTIEVKTLKTGLNEAFKDYKDKTSYQKFLACIGTDGIKAFITTDPTSVNYYYWDAYGDNVNSLCETQLENILNELVLNKDNIMFYFKYCVFEAKSYTKNFLVNHRVQQYFTLKKFDLLMSNNLNNKNEIFRKVVKHVQRSGKSITIKSVVNLLADKYMGVFKKIYINVPDTVISSGIEKTFSDLKIAGTGKPINLIKDRSDYLRSINSNNTGLEVYLMNIQKTTNLFTKDSYNGKDVLIIVDEVHTHQQGKFAQTRLRNFPNASMLTFTATPKMKESKSMIRNTTNEVFSDDNQYLDEFNATDALKLGIVLPIVYEKSRFRQEWDQVKNKKYDDAMLAKIENVISVDSRIQAMIDDELDVFEEELILQGKLTRLEIDKAVEKEKENITNREISKVNSKVLAEEINYVKESLIPTKIEFIAADVINKRNQTFSDMRTNKVLFPTKSFWCVESVEMAINIMKKIKEISDDPVNKTTYKGVRFATDFSMSPTEKRSGVHLEELNGRIFNGKTIIDDFEAENNCVDVLIIVGKYLMGYDEQKLVTIYLDTIINEPARLFQLITRPCTARKDKLKGFVVDLTMDERNYETFKKALAWYDSDKDINSFILTEEIIKEEKKNIENCVKNISKILDIDVNNLESEGIVYNKLINLNLEQQMNYFNLFKLINQSFKILVSPNYYFDSLDIFYHLLNVNKMYYDGLAKPAVIYDRNLIRQIIEETFQCLGLKSINDIVKYDMLGKTLRTQDQDRITDLEYTNKFHKARLFAQNNQPPALGRTFYDWLEERLAEIAISNMKSDETKAMVLDIEAKIEEEKKRIIKLINDEFNGDKYFYSAYEIILDQCKSASLTNDKDSKGYISFVDNTPAFENVVKVIAKHFSDEIVSRIRMRKNTEYLFEEYVKSILSSQSGIKKDWLSLFKDITENKDIVKFIYLYVLNVNNIDNVLEIVIYSIMNEYKNGNLNV